MKFMRLLALSVFLATHSFATDQNILPDENDMKHSWAASNVKTLTDLDNRNRSELKSILLDVYMSDYRVFEFLNKKIIDLSEANNLIKQVKLYTHTKLSLPGGVDLNGKCHNTWYGYYKSMSDSLSIIFNRDDITDDYFRTLICQISEHDYSNNYLFAFLSKIKPGSIDLKFRANSSKAFQQLELENARNTTFKLARTLYLKLFPDNASDISKRISADGLYQKLQLPDKPTTYSQQLVDALSYAQTNIYRAMLNAAKQDKVYDEFFKSNPIEFFDSYHYSDGVITPLKIIPMETTSNDNRSNSTKQRLQKKLEQRKQKKSEADSASSNQLSTSALSSSTSMVVDDIGPSSDDDLDRQYPVLTSSSHSDDNSNIINELNSKIKYLTEQLLELTKKHSELKNSNNAITDLQSLNEQNKSLLSEKDKIITKLTNQLSELNTKVNERDTLNKELQKSKKTAQDNLLLLKQKNNELADIKKQQEQYSADYEGRLQEKDSLINRLKKDKEQLANGNKQLQAEAERHRNLSQNSSSSLKQKEEQLATAIKELKTKSEESKKKIEEKEKEIKLLRVENENTSLLKAKVEELTKTIIEKNEAIEKLSTQKNDASQAKIDEKAGDVGEDSEIDALNKVIQEHIELINELNSQIVSKDQYIYSLQYQNSESHKAYYDLSQSNNHLIALFQKDKYDTESIVAKNPTFTIECEKIQHFVTLADLIKLKQETLLMQFKNYSFPSSSPPKKS